MILITRDPAYWSRLGWTPELARKRMSDCRKEVKNCRRRGYSYRYINVALYEKAKIILAILTK